MNDELLIANLVKRKGDMYSFDLMIGGNPGWALIIGMRIFQGKVQPPMRTYKGKAYRPTMYFDTATAARVYQAVKAQCPHVKLADEYRTLAELAYSDHDLQRLDGIAQKHIEEVAA